MMKKTIMAFFIVIFVFNFYPMLQINKALAIDCSSSSNIVTQFDKDFCQKELDALEIEYNNALNRQIAQQKKTGTIKGDVDYLTSQISALKTKIKSRSVAVASLKVSINDKVSKIESLSEKIDREHSSIAQLLRNTNDFDDKNLAHLILSDENISTFYSDLESYTSIKESVKSSVEKINGIKAETENQKKDLETKRNAELDAKSELENTQKKVAQSEAEKKQLLAVSKQKESDYKAIADDKKAKANKIRSALFSLAGISTKIEFGTALQYANEAKNKTGVAPAFLLAILTQESNLGSNVGQCFLTDITGPNAGYGVSTKGKTWTNLMKPSRDLQPFLDITSRLGLDPLKTAVSCPIAGVKGYGGALGPAQFIASTWKLIENRLATYLGVSTPNPWAPRDAFMASAIFLSDLGASGSSYSSQIKAACKYYGSGGSSCSYGKSVMKLVADIQINKIDPLQGY